MADVKDLQARINERADARLQADLEKAWRAFEPFKQGTDGRSTRVNGPDGKQVELLYNNGVLWKIKEQLKEQFRDQYRAEESAKFLGEVTAMRTRFEEITGEAPDGE